MIGFLTSISVFGWVLIGIVGLGLWHLPRLVRGAGRSTLPERRMQPGEQPASQHTTGIGGPE